MFKKSIIKFFILLSGIVLTYTLISRTIQTQEALHKKIGSSVTLHIVQGDITQMKVDAVVNAANEKLAAGEGVCGAIFSAAQRKSLLLTCYIRDHYPNGIKPGQAIITPSFILKNLRGIQHIIHAVGPIYKNYENKAEAAKILKQTYQESLALAFESKDISSIAFPFISSGIYGYPKEEAAEIALKTIQEFAQKVDASKATIKDIYFVLMEPDDFNLFIRTLNPGIHEKKQIVLHSKQQLFELLKQNRKIANFTLTL